METFYSFVQCRHLEIHQQTIKNQPSIIEFLVLNGKTVRIEVMDPSTKYFIERLRECCTTSSHSRAVEKFPAKTKQKFKFHVRI